MRGFISGSLLVAVTVAVVANPAAVRGQQSSTAAQDAAAEARQAYDAGRKQDAIEAYKRAYELSGDHALLFRLGEVNREIGQDVVALRFYRSYVARDPRGKFRQAAERAVRELDLKLAKPAGVASEAARATSPAPVPSSGSSPSPSSSPSSSRSLPAVDLSAGATPAPAPPGPPLPRWLPWAGLGATLALGAGAVVTGLGASHRYDELHGSCAQRSEGCPTSDINDVKSRARTANLLWVAAGIGAAMTGVTFYVNTREAGFSGVWSF